MAVAWTGLLALSREKEKKVVLRALGHLVTEFLIWGLGRVFFFGGGWCFKSSYLNLAFWT